MLSCNECRKYLYAFLDRALEIRENLDVQEHLHACASCADVAEAERTVRGFVRQYAASPPLPEHIKRQLIQHAMQTPEGRMWWSGVLARLRSQPWGTGVAAAAAAFVVAFIGFSVWSGEDDLTQKVLNEASMAYRVYNNNQVTPLEVQGPDDTAVSQWFYQHIGYRLPVPGLTDQKTQLVGGRLCRLLDRTGAAVFYQRQGSNMLLFVFKDDKLSLPTKNVIRTNAGSFYVQNVSGRPMAVWQRGGITYSLVGDLDQDALLQVASTASYR